MKRRKTRLRPCPDCGSHRTVLRYRRARFQWRRLFKPRPLGWKLVCHHCGGVYQRR